MKTGTNKVPRYESGLSIVGYQHAPLRIGYELDNPSSPDFRVKHFDPPDGLSAEAGQQSTVAAAIPGGTKCRAGRLRAVHEVPGTGSRAGHWSAGPRGLQSRKRVDRHAGPIWSASAWPVSVDGAAAHRIGRPTGQRHRLAGACSGRDDAHAHASLGHARRLLRRGRQRCTATGRRG